MPRTSHSSPVERFRAEAAHALSRIRHYQAQGDPAQVDRWHQAWSLAQTAADAELREKGAGARVVRLKSPPPLRPLPEGLSALSLPPAFAPEEETKGTAAATPSVPARPQSEDALAAALERHSRIERALRGGGPNPFPDELDEGKWQEHLAAFQYGGPYDCELLQEAEGAVEALVEMLPEYWEPKEAEETDNGNPDLEQLAAVSATLPECVRIYRESLPELTEDELRADLVTCLDAGRADTAALIEEELRRREREEPPPPVPGFQSVRVHEPKAAAPIRSESERTVSPAPPQPFFYARRQVRARTAARGCPMSAPAEIEPEGSAERQALGYTTAPAWVDTAGRTRTWNLLDPSGEKLAEIATKRDAEKMATLLTRLLGTSPPPQ